MEAHEKAIKHVVREKGYKYKKITKYIDSIFGNDDPDIKYIKNLRYNGKDLISIRINDNKFENRFYTIKKIKRLSDKLSDKLLKKGVQGKMMTSLLYGDLGWKSGYLKTFGETTKLYDPNILYNMATPYEEPKEIKSFNIYIALGNRDIGGDDDLNNDCLYNCLKYYIFNIEEYFKSPAELKTFLKLKRNDKIPLSCIDQIENKLKNYQINIRGDFIRTSIINSNKQINITLSNEHYSVEKKNHKFLRFLKFNEKTLLLFDKKHMIVFDGSNKWEITKSEKHKIIYDYNSKYIIMHRQKPERDDEGNKIEISIEEEYKNLIEIADT